MNIQDLFKAIINFFTINEIPYFLIRNYEDYPDKFTGDIDFYIDLECLAAKLNEYETLISNSEWEVFVKVDRPWVLVYQLFSKLDTGGRNIISIEHFNKFSWLSFDYYDFKKLRESMITHNGISVLPRHLGYFLSFNHYYYWAGFIPEKYHELFLDFFNFPDIKKLLKESYPYSIKYIQKEIGRIKLLTANDWRTENNIPERIYHFNSQYRLIYKLLLIIRDFVKHPAGTLQSLFKLVALRMRDYFFVRGKIFIMSPNASTVPTHLLFILKKYHLFNNKNSSVFPISGKIRLVRILYDQIIFYRIIAKGGACILSVSSLERYLRTITRLFFHKHVIVVNDNDEINNELSLISLLRAKNRTMINQSVDEK
jgi:hypothetical protein